MRRGMGILHSIQGFRVIHMDEALRLYFIRRHIVTIIRVMMAIRMMVILTIINRIYLSVFNSIFLL